MLLGVPIGERLRARAGARTSRPLMFGPWAIVSEISIGGNAADETSALREEAA